MTKPSPARTPESLDTSSSGSPTEMRALAKWYDAARIALAHNRPLTIAVTPNARLIIATDLSSAEATALRMVGAFEDQAPVQADNDPLIKSQAQFMALLREGLSATEAAKLLDVDVSRVRQRLRGRSLFGIEYSGHWRLPRFQFDRRLVIPGLARVLAALPSDLFPLDLVDWFVLPDADLRRDTDPLPLSPREWLLCGRPIEAVVALARDLTRA